MSETANGINPHMWRELIPPQTPPKSEEPETPKPKVAKLSLFSNLLAWWRNARERKLRVRIARLETKLAAAEYERDLLVEINKNLSTWIAASTATVAPIAAILSGSKEPAPPPPKSKRTTGVYG